MRSTIRRNALCDYRENLPIIQPFHIVDCLAVPVVREMRALGRDGDHVGPENGDALALGKAHAGPGDAVRPGRAARVDGLAPDGDYRITPAALPTGTETDTGESI